jgi:cytochrome c biogenesis protein
MWVKVHEEDGAVRVEYAGLARGDDPGLAAAVRELADEHSGTPSAPGGPADEPSRTT